MQPRTIHPVGGRVQLQLGLVLTQWLHALTPQQDNNVIELRHEWLQLGFVPHTTGLRHVVVPHTTVATRYFPPGSTPHTETRILTVWRETHTTICHRESLPRFEPRLRLEEDVEPGFVPR